MGHVGFQYSFRFTEEETLEHSQEVRNECSTISGGGTLFGFSAGADKNKCTGSLSDTTTGENTAVKRFTASSYGIMATVDMNLN